MAERIGIEPTTRAGRAQQDSGGAGRPDLHAERLTRAADVRLQRLAERLAALVEDAGAPGDAVALPQRSASPLDAYVLIWLDGSVGGRPHDRVVRPAQAVAAGTPVRPS